jgi:hypothetical protein
MEQAHPSMAVSGGAAPEKGRGASPKWYKYKINVGSETGPNHQTVVLHTVIVVLYFN